MEYEYAQILYKYLENFKTKYKGNKRHYKELAYYFNVDVYTLNLDNNEVAEVNCNDNKCEIILDNKVDSNLVLTAYLIPIVLLYKDTKNKEFSSVEIYYNDNILKYSDLYKMFAYDILFYQDNLYTFIKEGRKNNVQKK